MLASAVLRFRYITPRVMIKILVRSEVWVSSVVRPPGIKGQRPMCSIIRMGVRVARAKRATPEKTSPIASGLSICAKSENLKGKRLMRYSLGVFALIALFILAPSQWNTASAQTAISFSFTGSGGQIPAAASC
jgi:hypothetical protein